jgi:hypothetical protein
MLVYKNNFTTATSAGKLELPSPEGVIKINCDGGFQEEGMTGTGSSGVVIRTSNGSFLGPSARWIPSVSSVLVTEAEACRDSLRLALV